MGINEGGLPRAILLTIFLHYLQEAWSPTIISLTECNSATTQKLPNWS